MWQVQGLQDAALPLYSVLWGKDGTMSYNSNNKHNNSVYVILQIQTASLTLLV